MENSAKTLSFPKFAYLTRDKANYPIWSRHAYNALQAMGVEEAISPEFQEWKFDSDNSSSDEDDDDFNFSRISLDGSRHHSQPQPPPTPYNGRPTPEQQFKQLFESVKKGRRDREREKERRQKQKEFETKKKRMDAKAKNAIYCTIDAQGFAASTMDCTTAHQLWEALKPTEAYTEEEVQRSLSDLRPAW